MNKRSPVKSGGGNRYGLWFFLRWAVWFGLLFTLLGILVMGWFVRRPAIDRRVDDAIAMVEDEQSNVAIYDIHNEIESRFGSGQERRLDSFLDAPPGSPWLPNSISEYRITSFPIIGRQTSLYLFRTGAGVKLLVNRKPTIDDFKPPPGLGEPEVVQRDNTELNKLKLKKEYPWVAVEL